MTTLVSVIVPIHNGSPWIDKCFSSVLNQNLSENVHIEVCVCNDASTDDTNKLLTKWEAIFIKRNITLKDFNNESTLPGGATPFLERRIMPNAKNFVLVGFSKNKAVSISCGTYLCFQDIDDIMLPDRISKQFERAKLLPDNVIIGCKFHREPRNATARYTKWANSLSKEQLNVQIYTSNGPTVIMPTWFCHRSVFDKVGGFSTEHNTGVPEDLIFFYKHLDSGGTVDRVDEVLLTYTYHENAATFSILESTIWDVRLKHLEENVLENWSKFTIWNAGKQGRKFYKSLSVKNKRKVMAMCDVDKNKIGKQYIPFDEATRTAERPIEIVHFKNAITPLIICVKMDLTDGHFEENLKSLHLTEGRDYILFS